MLNVIPQARIDHRLGHQQTTPKFASPTILQLEFVIEALVKEIRDRSIDRRLPKQDDKVFHRIRPFENSHTGKQWTLMIPV
uniref:Uncharacterized protein n=1 Tax=Hyaloperonospora arabidopsidis (strain Emoy2) TaxID=559515 RepID=M4BYX6_HYAAE